MSIKRTAYVEIRSQSAKGSWPRQGPDTYVAVQVVPEGAVRLAVLNSQHAAMRGIKIIYCGEGYHNRTGPTSSYGKALAEAERIAEEINRENKSLPRHDFDTGKTRV